MLNSVIHINQRKQLGFFNALEALMQQDYSNLNLDAESEAKFKEIVLQAYSEDLDTNNYFKWKNNLFDSNAGHSLISLNNLPQHFNVFATITDPIKKLLLLLLNSEFYETLDKALWQRFEEDLKQECKCVETILYSENIVSIRFQKSTNELEIQQTKDYIMYSFFQAKIGYS